MRAAMLLSVVLLAGCATPSVVPEVRVPVYTPCIRAAPERPAFATRSLAPDASDGEKILAIARDLAARLYRLASHVLDTEKVH